MNKPAGQDPRTHSTLPSPQYLLVPNMAARGQTDRKAMGLLPPTFQALLFDYLPPDSAISGYTTEEALCGYKLTANLMPTVS